MRSNEDFVANLMKKMMKPASCAGHPKSEMNVLIVMSCRF